MIQFLSKSIFVLVLMFQALSFGASLDIKITNIEEAKGKMIVYLCENETCHENIKKLQLSGEAKKLKNRLVNVTNTGEISVRFDNLGPGSYSVFCLHDLDGNEEPKFNGALPEEPFGVSKMEEVGPKPSFDDSKIDLAKENSSGSVEIPMLKIENEFLKAVLPVFSQRELEKRIIVLSALNSRCG